MLKSGMSFSYGEAGVAVFDGEIDIAVREPFERAVRRACVEGRCGVADLTGVRFVDSSAVRALITCADERFSRGLGQLTVLAGPRVARITDALGPERLGTALRVVSTSEKIAEVKTGLSISHAAE